MARFYAKAEAHSVHKGFGYIWDQKPNLLMGKPDAMLQEKLQGFQVERTWLKTFCAHFKF